MLHDLVHILAACPFSCRNSMSMLNVHAHAHAAHQCPPFMSMSLLHTVITGQSVYQEYLEKGLFHSELCGFFPMKIFPEAEGKISTKLSLMEIFPHICKYLSI
jgi:hypothetical protein